jgi:carboxyl-terminal processing protease
MLPDEIGYIKVAAVNPGSVKDVSGAISNLQRQGAKKLILDLRYSATGDPEEGVDIANLFLDKGLIAYASGQKFPRRDFNADPKKDVTALPLVVLTNRGTAAAAEVAAAALQGDKRAKIVGEHTYGDASILRPITMDDGSAIILSVAKYYSPEGKSIQDNGVMPDELVAEPESGAPDVDDDNEPSAPAGKKPAGDAILNRGIEIAKNQQ